VGREVAVIRFRGRSRVLILLLCIIALGVGFSPADAVKVDVQLNGLEGDAEQNVEALVSLDHQDQKTLTDLQVQRLHERAPAEIRRGLEPFGWYRPSIEGTLTRVPGGWLATYRVVPGPRVLVTGLDLTLAGDGANDPELIQLVQLFPLHEGDPLLHASYEQGKLAINEWAARTGYLDGRFTEQHVDVDPAASTARIVLHYDTGPRYRYGPVRFEQSVLDERLLRSTVDFRQGEPLDYRPLLELQGHLRQSSYFIYAEVTPRRDLAQGTEVPIIVTLTPSKRLRLEAGAGYGTDTGPQGRAAAELRRLNRWGHRARIDAAGSIRKQQRASASYSIPRGRLDSALFTAAAGFQRENLPTSFSQTWLGSVRQTGLRGPWQETVGLEYRRERFIVGPDAGTTRLLTPVVEYVRTQVDDAIDTRRGFRLAATARGALDAVLSDLTLVQLTTRDQGILPVGASNRLLGRVELAWTTTRDFRDLPPTLRFWAGGANSVRGYGYHGLGVKDPNTGQVIGGPQLMVGSLEFEHRLRKRWGIATFYDIGNAVNRFNDPLKSGAGVGVRWISPVGPVRVDAAWALSLDRHPMRIHLRIGPDL
jgi:translocation and assembly module TamA